MGFLSPPPAPAAPDYTGAANATAAGNLEAARAAASGNRINQITPYGALTYTIARDAKGNLVKDPYGNYSFTATTSLSPMGQGLLDQQNRLATGLFGSQNNALDYIGENLNRPFNPNLPSVGVNPGQTYQQAQLQQLAPVIKQQRDRMNQNLANQGIGIGSEAWRNSQTQQAQNENNLLAQATTQGMNVGLQANQNAFNQEAYKYNQPINTLASLRSGSQVTNPTFQNVPQQATTSGPDLLGAAQAQHNAAMGGFNAQQAAAGNLQSGLFSLGGAALMASDIRIKENIGHVGSYGGLPVYEFDYKEEFKDLPLAGKGRHVGFMAQDVEQIAPHAVFEIDGIKHINYGILANKLGEQ